MMSNNANRTLYLRHRIQAAASELRDLTQVAQSGQGEPSLHARLTTLNEQGQPGTTQSIVIKDFDEQGVTFYHQSPLSSRRAILMIEKPPLGRLAAEVDLTWCQFNSTGRYTSGGRFVQLAGKTA
ncbi:MAG: hypothetical protein KDA57_10825 [Planctomycetales bacterium]|nr:hypothetical protein [Planctomycetales bacterium]